MSLLPMPIQMQNNPQGQQTSAPQGNQLVSDDVKKNHAYKYIGYPEYCRFMSSDNDFFLIRRFGELNARVLLRQQFEITRLETELHGLDRKCAHDPDDDERNHSFAWDEDSPKYGHARLVILDQLKPLLRDYSKCLRRVEKGANM